MQHSDQEAKEYYDRVADVYDKYLPLTFATFGEDESEVRNGMIDKLYLTPTSVVLETGAGTGLDSVLIAERLGTQGKLYLQDISRKILEKSYPKLAEVQVPVEYHIGNACYLPFDDNYFDAAYHFGGLNTFSDIGRALREMNRVVKVGGRVVVGDESMPPWLRDTEFGKILMNTNYLYKCELPLQYIPVSARNVKLEWIIGGVFYVIDYTVGEGEPQADFDFEIPGARGGTHRTRYYGQLEGVTSEVKELAYKAQVASGKSMHRWLDDVIREAARC